MIYQGNVSVSTNVERMPIVLPGFSSQPCRPYSFVVLIKEQFLVSINNYQKEDNRERHVKCRKLSY